MSKSLSPSHPSPYPHKRYTAAWRAVLRLVLISISACSWLVFFSWLVPATLSAQGGELRNQPRRGLIYDGLKRSERPGCRPGFEFRVPNNGRPFCTHGPDPSPLGTNVRESPAPVAVREQAALAVCDGNGQSGNRVQVLYARSSDRPDRYATYVTSIQQWSAEIDGMVSNSALQTGGDRRVRYVHDGACQLDISNVVLPPEGDDSIGNTIQALFNLGFNRSDRKYLIYMDAMVYCGIATMGLDDSPWSTNVHNQGGFYARVDAGCWSSGTAAHELMHTLGGVQSSAPHSTPRWHCYDESDRMCYADGTGIAMQYLCAAPNESLFDCNHDDYFNSNPPANSYLATHWNTANNVFLIGAVPIRGMMRVESLVTGKVNKQGVLKPADTFKWGNTVTVRGMIRDQDDLGLGGASIVIRVIRPDTSVHCERAWTLDSTGGFESECEIPRKAPVGQWAVVVVSLSKAEYIVDPGSISSHSFTVTAK
ncbi:MAG: hypothetical protein IT331_16600 [Anaerolineae bacterium]|nr:hypothetical protein [Anaerolineae bacterium]